MMDQMGSLPPDFRIEVTVRSLRANPNDTYGIMFGNPALTAYFELDGQGFGVVERMGTPTGWHQSKTLVNTNDAEVRALFGTAIRLAVEVRGREIRCFINGRPVASTQASGSLNGSIGLLTIDNGATAVFSDLRFSQLLAQTPSNADGSSNSTADQSWNAGLSYYHARDMRQAAQAFYQAAKLGHARAATALGLMYMRGEGVPKKLDASIYWLEKGAAGGDSEADYSVGEIYKSGTLVPVDYARAVKYFSLGAEGNDPKAERELGLAYEFGEGGLPRDHRTALKWLAKSAGDDRLGEHIYATLSDPGTPRFQTEDQLITYMTAEAMVAQGLRASGGYAGIRPYSPSYRPQTTSGNQTASGSSGCGGYTDYGACNAHKVGEDWAAERLQNHESSGSEHDWYNN